MLKERQNFVKSDFSETAGSRTSTELVLNAVCCMHYAFIVAPYALARDTKIFHFGH